MACKTAKSNLQLSFYGRILLMGQYIRYNPNNLICLKGNVTTIDSKRNIVVFCLQRDKLVLSPRLRYFGGYLGISRFA